jgi:Fe2+ or Zn2+ uptake regulation protein
MPRKTRQKEAILRVVKGTLSHPGAEWVYEQVKQEIPAISLGTVYRNLRLLKEDGRISGIESGATGRFDGNTRKHYHFRCEKCERIFDVDLPVNRKLNDKVAERTGFKVDSHRLEFHGLCKDCA